MQAIALRGGTGSHTALKFVPRKPTKAVLRLETALAAKREAQEAAFDRQAHQEAAALRSHRRLVPARLLAHGRTA